MCVFNYAIMFMVSLFMVNDLELKSTLMNYTPNGYLVPAEFGLHFLPCMKNVPKRTKMHSNEVGLTNTEIC